MTQTALEARIQAIAPHCIRDAEDSPAEDWIALSDVERIISALTAPVQRNELENASTLLHYRLRETDDEAMNALDLLTKAALTAPVGLEWRDDHLLYNGRSVGWVQNWKFAPNEWQVHFQGDFSKCGTEDEARAALETAAREWLRIPTQPNVAELVEALEALFEDTPDLADAFKFIADDDLNEVFDAGLRHKTGITAEDHLKRFLFFFRPFAYATKDDSWGELEKLVSITLTSYVRTIKRVHAARATLSRAKGG